MNDSSNSSSGSYSETATGDSGPWARWLGLAWRMAAGPDGNHRRPPRPGPDSTLEAQMAWWAPALHLLCYGLGWTQPQAGLARWLEMGAPTDDPLVAAVGRWWGADIEDLLAWAYD